jgi:hypothetical protein
LLVGGKKGGWSREGLHVRLPERPKPGELALSDHASGKRQRLRREAVFGGGESEHDDRRHDSEARHPAIFFLPAPDVNVQASGQAQSRDGHLPYERGMR